jgi:hypothetical protein
MTSFAEGLLDSLGIPTPPPTREETYEFALKQIDDMVKWWNEDTKDDAMIRALGHAYKGFLDEMYGKVDEAEESALVSRPVHTAFGPFFDGVKSTVDALTTIGLRERILTVKQGASDASAESSSI